MEEKEKENSHKEKCREEIDCKEIITALYGNLVKEIRELERNYISLLVPLISAIAIYGIGLKSYLESQCEQNFIFFTITTAATVFISIVIWFSANIFAYSHRVNQIIISKIESKCDLYNTKEGILPPKWNLSARLSSCKDINPPDIYRLFKLSAMIIAIGGIGIYIYLSSFFTKFEVISFQISIKIPNLQISVAITLLVVLFVYYLSFKWCRCIKKDELCKPYIQKLKDLYKDEKHGDCSKVS